MNKSTGFLICSIFLIFMISYKAKACTGRDVIFTNITVTAINASDYQYSYQIQNIGTTDIAFNQLVIQNYVSADNTYDQNDQPAGGTFIDNTNAGTLAAGATYSGTMGVYPGSYTQGSYPYIIAHIYLSSDQECDANNDYYTALIQVTAIARPSYLINASLNWNANTKSFIVKDWPGNHSVLQYRVYTSSGILTLSQDTRENEPTSLPGLKDGFYILSISDGEKIYAEKIMY